MSNDYNLKDVFKIVRKNVVQIIETSFTDIKKIDNKETLNLLKVCVVGDVDYTLKGFGDQIPVDFEKADDDDDVNDQTIIEGLRAELSEASKREKLFKHLQVMFQQQLSNREENLKSIRTTLWKEVVSLKYLLKQAHSSGYTTVIQDETALNEAISPRSFNQMDELESEAEKSAFNSGAGTLNGLLKEANELNKVGGALQKAKLEERLRQQNEAQKESEEGFKLEILKLRYELEEANCKQLATEEQILEQEEDYVDSMKVIRKQLSDSKTEIRRLKDVLIANDDSFTEQLEKLNGQNSDLQSGLHNATADNKSLAGQNNALLSKLPPGELHKQVSLEKSVLEFMFADSEDGSLSTSKINISDKLSVTIEAYLCDNNKRIANIREVRAFGDVSSPELIELGVLLSQATVIHNIAPPEEKEILRAKSTRIVLPTKKTEKRLISKKSERKVVPRLKGALATLRSKLPSDNDEVNDELEDPGEILSSVASEASLSPTCHNPRSIENSKKSFALRNKPSTVRSIRRGVSAVASAANIFRNKTTDSQQQKKKNVSMAIPEVPNSVVQCDNEVEIITDHKQEKYSSNQSNQSNQFRSESFCRGSIPYVDSFAVNTTSLTSGDGTQQISKFNSFSAVAITVTEADTQQLKSSPSHTRVSLLSPARPTLENDSVDECNEVSSCEDPEVGLLVPTEGGGCCVVEPKPPAQADSLSQPVTDSFISVKGPVTEVTLNENSNSQEVPALLSVQSEKDYPISTNDEKAKSSFTDMRHCVPADYTPLQSGSVAGFGIDNNNNSEEDKGNQSFVGSLPLPLLQTKMEKHSTHLQGDLPQDLNQHSIQQNETKCPQVADNNVAHIKPVLSSSNAINERENDDNSSDGSSTESKLMTFQFPDDTIGPTEYNVTSAFNQLSITKADRSTQTTTLGIALQEKEESVELDNLIHSLLHLTQLGIPGLTQATTSLIRLGKGLGKRLPFHKPKLCGGKGKLPGGPADTGLEIRGTGHGQTGGSFAIKTKNLFTDIPSGVAGVKFAYPQIPSSDSLDRPLFGNPSIQLEAAKKIDVSSLSLLPKHIFLPGPSPPKKAAPLSLVMPPPTEAASVNRPVAVAPQPPPRARKHSPWRDVEPVFGTADTQVE